MPRDKSVVADLASIRAQRQAERRDISVQALALARRAEQAGLTIAAYLLDLAALETGADLTIRRFGPDDAQQEP